MVACPHCGQPWNGELVVEPDNSAADHIALRRECSRQSIPVSWDGYVSTAGAGKLLRKEAKTLRKWREQGRGPRYRKADGRSGHVEYSLADLAAHRSKFFDALAK